MWLPRRAVVQDADGRAVGSMSLQQDSGQRPHLMPHLQDLGIQSLVGSPDPELRGQISCQFQGQGSPWKGREGLAYAFPHFAALVSLHPAARL